MKSMNVLAGTALTVSLLAGCTGSPEQSQPAPAYSTATPAPSGEAGSNQEAAPDTCMAMSTIIMAREVAVRYNAPAGSFKDEQQATTVANEIATRVVVERERARHAGSAASLISEVFALGTDKQVNNSKTRGYMELIAQSEANAVRDIVATKDPNGKELEVNSYAIEDTTSNSGEGKPTPQRSYLLVTLQRKGGCQPTPEPTADYSGLV